MNTTTSKNLIVTEYSELLQIHINNCLWRYINTGWLDLVADVLEINHTIVDTKEYITNTKYVKNSLIISSLLNNLTILSSEFIGNSATVEGGVIYFQTLVVDITINSSSFINFTVTDCGGVFYFRDIGNLALLNNIFVKNSAVFGGGIYYEDSKGINSFSIKNNKFIENNGYNGGGIYIYKNMPNLIFINENIFINNTANYGNDFASYPYGLKLEKNSNSKIKLNRLKQYFIEAYPGIKLEEFSLDIIDHYNQFISTENGDVLLIHVSDKINYNISQNKSKFHLVGSTIVSSLNGAFKVNDLVLYGEINKIYYLIISSNSFIDQPRLNISKNEKLELMINYTQYYFYIPIHMRNCPEGYLYINDALSFSSSKICQICTDGTYTLTTDIICKKCPSGATCAKGILSVDTGYWRSNNFSENIYLCSPNKFSCVFNSICDPRYIGPMCQTCSKGYGVEIMSGECNQCFSSFFSVFLIVLMILFYFGLHFYLFRSSLEDLVLTKENLFRNSLQDGYLKIMMNYSQYLIVLINLDLNWFGVVKSIFIVQTTSLGANYKMISFDCMMKEISETPQIYLLSLIFTILPFIFSILFLMYLIIKQKGCKPGKMIQNLCFCSSLSIFLLQSSIFNALLEVFKCKEIDGKKYISSYLMESCESERYYKWSYYFVLPSFCWYAIVIPLALMLFMAKNKNNLYSVEVMKYIGFSLNGLGKTKFYWDIFFIYFKLILISISLFIGNGDNILKYLTLLLFLLFNILFRKWDPPFLTSKLNSFDMNGSISLFIIFYGVVLASYFENDVFNIFILVLTLILNFQFMIIGCRALLLFTLFKILQIPNQTKLQQLINKCFSTESVKSEIEEMKKNFEKESIKNSRFYRAYKSNYFFMSKIMKIFSFRRASEENIKKEKNFSIQMSSNTPSHFQKNYKINVAKNIHPITNENDDEVEELKNIILVQKNEISKLHKIIENLQNELDHKEKILEKNYKHDNSLEESLTNSRPQEETSYFYKPNIAAHLKENVCVGLSGDEEIFDEESNKERFEENCESKNIVWDSCQDTCLVYDENDLEIKLEKEATKNSHLFVICIIIKNKGEFPLDDIKISFVSSEDLVVLEDNFQKNIDLHTDEEATFKSFVKLILTKPNYSPCLTLKISYNIKLRLFKKILSVDFLPFWFVWFHNISTKNKETLISKYNVDVFQKEIDSKDIKTWIRENMNIFTLFYEENYSVYFVKFRIIYKISSISLLMIIKSAEKLSKIEIRTKQKHKKLVEKELEFLENIKSFILTKFY